MEVLQAYEGEWERCCPEKFVPPTPTELAEVRAPFARKIEERDIRARRHHDPLFTCWKEERVASGFLVELHNEPGNIEEFELRGIEDWFRYLKEHTRVIKCPTIDLAKLRITTGRYTDRNPQIPKNITHEGDFILVDVNNEPFFWRMENGLEEAFRGIPDSEDLEAQTLKYDKRLEDIYPAAVDVSDNQRHLKDEYHIFEQRWHLDQDIAYGTSHIGLMAPRGMGNVQDYKIAGYMCQYKSQELRGGPPKHKDQLKRQAAAETWSKESSKTEGALALGFKALCPKLYDDAHQWFDELARNNLVTRYNRYSVSLLGARVVNKAVGGHLDASDSKKALAMSVNFGEWSGGDFCLPSLGIRMQHLPRDAIWMCAKLIPHAVTKFVGQRTAYIFTSHSDRESAVKHRNDMDNEERVEYDEKQRIKREQKTAKADSMRENELKLIANILGENADVSSGELQVNNMPPAFFSCDAYYKMYHVPGIPPKLNYGRTEKTKIIKTLAKSSQEEVGEMMQKYKQGMEIPQGTTFEELPASLFYKFGPREQQRMDKSEDPFLGKDGGLEWKARTEAKKRKREEKDIEE